jgi:hypothetical protein
MANDQIFARVLTDHRLNRDGLEHSVIGSLAASLHQTCQAQVVQALYCDLLYSADTLVEAQARGVKTAADNSGYMSRRNIAKVGRVCQVPAALCSW